MFNRNVFIIKLHGFLKQFVLQRVFAKYKFVKQRFQNMYHYEKV